MILGEELGSEVGLVLGVELGAALGILLEAVLGKALEVPLGPAPLGEGRIRSHWRRDRSFRRRCGKLLTGGISGGIKLGGSGNLSSSENLSA